MKKHVLFILFATITLLNSIHAQAEEAAISIYCDSVVFDVPSSNGLYLHIRQIDTDYTTSSEEQYSMQSAIDYLEQKMSTVIDHIYNPKTGEYTFMPSFNQNSALYHEPDTFGMAYPMRFATLDLSGGRATNILVEHIATYKAGDEDSPRFTTHDDLITAIGFYQYFDGVKSRHDSMGTGFYFGFHPKPYNLQYYFLPFKFDNRYPTLYFALRRDGSCYKVKREYVQVENTTVDGIYDDGNQITISPGLVNRSTPVSVNFGAVSYAPRLINVTSLAGITEMSIDVSGEESCVSIDTSLLSSGLHIVSVIQNGAIIKTAKIIVR